MTSASRPTDSPPRPATGRLSSRDRRTVIPLSAVVMESLFRFGQLGYLGAVTSGEVPFDGVALPTSATMTPAPWRHRRLRARRAWWYEVSGAQKGSRLTKGADSGHAQGSRPPGTEQRLARHVLVLHQTQAA